jgi:hypothetical protein
VLAVCSTALRSAMRTCVQQLTVGSFPLWLAAQSQHICISSANPDNPVLSCRRLTMQSTHTQLVQHETFVLWAMLTCAVHCPALPCTALHRC